MGILRIPTLGRLLLAALAISTVPRLHAASAGTEYDVLIRGGQVFDGTAAPARQVDIGIKGDRIATVGRIPAGAKAGRVIDARGKYVTPGFIDPHSHSADGLSTASLAPAKPILLQGITTVMINPDGFGPGDLEPQLGAIRSHVPGVNVVPMIGHNGVRRAVMGEADRKATPAELDAMRKLVDKGMRDGSFGFSTGPFYVPGKFSDTHELLELTKVSARYPGSFYISHIRDESSYDVGLVGAVKELIDIARQAKIPAVVTHIKAIGPTVWGKSKEVIELINAARAEGLQIWADQYPYAASGSSLQPSLVPRWAQEGGAEALAARLKDPEQRSLIRKEMAANLERRAGANAIMIRSFPPDTSLEGRRLDEIALERGQDPLDVAIDMLIQGGAPIVSFNMNEKDVEAYMKQPWTMTCTDGSLVEFGKRSEHPRAYGAFPRKLRRYAIDRGVISVPQAIHSSSGLPATVFGIVDRGFLRPGYYADVLVFDPKRISDVATYQKPHAYSVGMDEILVNGELAVDQGQLTDSRHGRILLPARMLKGAAASGG